MDPDDRGTRTVRSQPAESSWIALVEQAADVERFAVAAAACLEETAYPGGVLDLGPL
jgi:hypothetical protein